MTKSAKNEIVPLFCVGCSLLWNSRNDRKHEKSPIPMKLVIDWALDACPQLAIDTDRHMQNQSPRMAEWWQKPDTGFVKMVPFRWGHYEKQQMQ
jgi:hypothetical protein